MPVSFSLSYTGKGDALQDQQQFTMGGNNTSFITIICRQFIGAFFQAFMIKGKAVTFPVQQLGSGYGVC